MIHRKNKFNKLPIIIIFNHSCHLCDDVGWDGGPCPDKKWCTKISQITNKKKKKERIDKMLCVRACTLSRSRRIIISETNWIIIIIIQNKIEKKGQRTNKNWIENKEENVKSLKRNERILRQSINQSINQFCYIVTFQFQL